MRRHIREHVKTVTGGAAPSIGLEVASLIRVAANLYEAIGSQHLAQESLSPARWRLLLLLLAHERHGNREGVTPTDLSRCEKVSKNTISSLLRSLEEQGLIERLLDPADRRFFRIRLTATGRALVESSAPQRIAHLNGLVSALTPAAQALLADLLEKLARSLLVRGGQQGSGEP